ncbi:MAG: hypothetical protein ACLRT5_07085 [Lachnospiraceae bacterium]
MDKTVPVLLEQADINDTYTESIIECFDGIPDVARPLVSNAGKLLKRIEKALYSAPSFLSVVKAAIPNEAYQVILSDEQRSKIASGALKLMTKKDGSLMANLIDPETKKIVSTVSLGKVKLSPELSQAMTSYASQMQLAQIAEEIQVVQMAVEEVRQGQEFDRLATAYSCQQKLIQAVAIQNPRLKEMALMQLVSDAEDSRNLLMQSQIANVEMIKNEPESTLGKMFSKKSIGEIDARMNELRESLNAVNIVSLAEAIAYQEMSEPEAARISLDYYAKFIRTTYLNTKGLVERLDMLDPSPENYWTQKLPEIEDRILALPSNSPVLSLEEQKNESETL